MTPLKTKAPAVIEVAALAKLITTLVVPTGGFVSPQISAPTRLLSLERVTKLKLFAP